MAIIKQLQDRDVGGICNDSIYPVTSTSAVCSLDPEGNAIEEVEPCLEDRLQAIESELKKKATMADLKTYIQTITVADIESMMGMSLESE